MFNTSNSAIIYYDFSRHFNGVFAYQDSEGKKSVKGVYFPLAFCGAIRCQKYGKSKD